MNDLKLLLTLSPFNGNIKKTKKLIIENIWSTIKCLTLYVVLKIILHMNVQDNLSINNCFEYLYYELEIKIKSNSCKRLTIVQRSNK